MAQQDANLIVIAPDGDLTIRVIEHAPMRTFALMRVSSQVLIDASDPFKVLLSGTFREHLGTNQELELREDTIASMEVWFRRLHNNTEPETSQISITELWNILEAARKYFLKIEMLDGWFANWFTAYPKMPIDVEHLKKLVYPAMSFNHAAAFAWITEGLAYRGVGHLKEINPTGYSHLHLPARVIQQINAAKGSLRTKLVTGIVEIQENFISLGCSCSEKALKVYCKSLQQCHVWDVLKASNKMSVMDVLVKLNQFRYTTPENSCVTCQARDPTHNVTATKVTVMGNFDGLCLDCMNSSKPKTGDVDSDYWNHDKIHHYDLGCRIKHGQATWYFSFMGRREEMDAHQRAEKERRRNREY